MAKAMVESASIVSSAALDAERLVRDLEALRVADRDPYPGEWFGLARRLVTARRQINRRR